MLAYTVFGRHLYGVGDNRNAARLSGLKVDRTVIIIIIIIIIIIAVALGFAVDRR